MVRGLSAPPSPFWACPVVAFSVPSPGCPDGRPLASAGAWARRARVPPAEPGPGVAFCRGRRE